MFPKIKFDKVIKKINKSSKKLDYIILALLIFFSIFLKLLVLNNISGDVSVSNDEECWVGTIANELKNGLKYSLIKYPLILTNRIYYNGRIIESVITYLMFGIFGVSGFSLKYTYIFISTCIIIVIYLNLLKYLGKLPAYISALFLVFSTPTLILQSLSQGGPHLSGAFMDMVLIFLTMHILVKKSKAFSYILFGLISGISIWINYMSLVTVGVLLIILTFDRRIKKINLFFVLIGLLAVSPLLWYQAKLNNFNDTTIFYIRYTKSNLSNPIILIPKLLWFSNIYLFMSSLLPRNLLILFFIIFTLLICISKLKKILSFPLVKIIILYLLIFAVFYTLVTKNFQFILNFRGKIDSYRHSVTLHYLFLIFVSFLISLLIKERKTIGVIFLVILICINIFGIISYIDLKNINFEKKYYYSPYCYDSIGYGLLNHENTKHEYFDDGLLQSCKKYEENFFDCMQGLRVLARIEPYNIKYCSNFDELTKKFCLLNFGRNNNFSDYKENPSQYGIYSFASYYEDEREQCIQENQTIINCTFKTAQKLSYVLGPNYLETEKIFCKKLPDIFKSDCYRGLGKRISEIYFLEPEEGLKKCELFPEEYSESCKKGFSDMRIIFTE